jgi:hypothetical protein
MDNEIAETKHASAEMQTRIRRMISDLDARIDSVTADTIRGFNDRIFNSLEEVAKNPPKGADINQTAQANINDVTSLMFANFKSDVFKELREVMRTQLDVDNAIPLSTFQSLQVENIGNLSLNVDLSLPELQRVNKGIAGAIKFVAVGATLGVVVKVAGGVAMIANTVKVAVTGGKASVLAASGAKAVETVATGVNAVAEASDIASAAKNVGQVVDAASNIATNTLPNMGMVASGLSVVDTVSDLGSIVSNRRTVRKIQAFNQEKMNETALVLPEKQAERAIMVAPPVAPPVKRGMLESLIGSITERTHARPQRQKMISDYILFNLQPDFKQRLEQISNGLVSNIEMLITEGSQDAIAQVKNNLEQLKAQKANAQGAYQANIVQLESFKNILTNGAQTNG